MSKTPAVYDFAAINAAALRGDAALFAAEKRCAESQEQIAAISRAHQPMTVAIEDELIAPIDAARVAAEHVIFNTMPDSLAGAAVKLRLLAHPDRGVDGTPEEVAALRQILPFVEAAAAAPGAVPDKRAAPSIALEKLIAEEKRTWDRHTIAYNAFEAALLPWKKANPDLDEEDDLPAEIATLKAASEPVTAKADALTERIANWIPDTVADAIRLLEWNRDKIESTVPESVLAGLRIIARAGDPIAKAPVTGDRRIMGLFREWRAAVDWANRPHADESDEAINAACAPVRAIEHAISEISAEDVAGLAVKLFLEEYYERGDRDCGLAASERSDVLLSALQDIARLVPELAPLVAPALAEENQP